MRSTELNLASSTCDSAVLKAVSAVCLHVPPYASEDLLPQPGPEPIASKAPK